MIRMIPCLSAQSAKSYFADSLSRADYYLDDLELTGKLQGLLTSRLGLDGEITRKAFHALCDNRHPVTGERLGARTKDNRRIGYDINFHCPKSVSILHGLSKDEHLRLAFEAAVATTMREIERGVKTRIRKAGSNEDRQTGELIWADFTHLTARPVEGFTPDPHLHAHCFVWNLTYDAVEDQIKAGQFGDIKRDMPFYQAMFHKRLSDGLIELGYQIRRTDKSFEVVGVPSRVLDLFSKRTDAIGRFAKEHGITDAQTLDGLGARTRAKKQKGLTMSELKAEWRRQILALGPDEDGDGNQAIRFAPVVTRTNLTAQQCVDHALLHGFERASVLAERRLLQAAFRHGMSYAAVSVESITEAFAADTRILRVKEQGRLLCTTREVLAEEQRMVDLARAGFGQLLPLYLQAPDIALDGQQGDALRHVLTTPHRVSIVRGAAGTGKTTLL
ncbi:MobF family relaxase, partial [Nostoc sp. NIES-2111]